jgi:hypothetical protein
MNVQFTKRHATVFTRFVECHEEKLCKLVTDIINGNYVPDSYDIKNREVPVSMLSFQGWSIRAYIELDDDDETVGRIDIFDNSMTNGKILELTSKENFERYYIKIENLVKDYIKCHQCENHFTFAGNAKFCMRCHPFVMKHTEDCSICMDNDEEKVWVKTPCGHVFHRNCIEKVECADCSKCDNITCPLCRTKFKKYQTRMI